MNEDRLGQAVPRLELGEKLVDIMDVPGAFDLGNHHHVELVADGADDFGDIVQNPRTVECVDPRPQAGFAHVQASGHVDEAAARRILRIGGNRVLQIAEQHVHPADEIGKLAPHLLILGREEMDHPFGTHRQFTQRFRGAGGERLVEMGGQLHGSSVDGRLGEALHLQRSRAPVKPSPAE